MVLAVCLNNKTQNVKVLVGECTSDTIAVLSGVHTSITGHED